MLLFSEAIEEAGMFKIKRCYNKGMFIVRRTKINTTN